VLQPSVHQLFCIAVVCGHTPTLISISLPIIFVLKLVLRVSSSQTLTSSFTFALSPFPHAIPCDLFPKLCSKGPEFNVKYLNDGLHFVVKVKQLWIVLFYLSCAIHSSFSLTWVKLPFHWSIQKQVRLHLFLVHYRPISQSFHKCFSLNCEVLPSADCPRSRNFKTCIESRSLNLKCITLSLRLGASFCCAACFLVGGAT